MPPLICVSRQRVTAMCYETRMHAIMLEQRRSTAAVGQKPRMPSSRCMATAHTVQTSYWLRISRVAANRRQV